MSSFEQWAQSCSQQLENAISKRLPSGEQFPQRLHQAMRYAALNGGKHFRPLLIYATAAALDLPRERVDSLAAAIELIHAYSLVHDDLPAMDDDDLRRGKPTCHKAFDDATAILAGDALQALAFRILSADDALTDDPAVRVRIIRHISDAIGSHGMAGGQAIDLESEGKSLNAAELEAMHIHKTGALIRAAVVTTAYCAPDVTRAQEEALDHFAKCVGLAFQIHDDVLDETGDAEEMGKTVGADRARDKNTYPNLFGLSESRSMARSLIDDARASLHDLGAKAEYLHLLAEFVISRRG
ncbi:farnesyl-diphosphate synthase [Oceanococcus atlanticus]|uniref:Farnesyl-diphosphate synthase n=1 Tax=Oceanococcus atlanticus TaxID=1317117 RepID=A0A1Y1SFF9_9GAMM|nr:farnesyl diphosphate synthase [Oceanococcus atlanticus]ORE88393.1 farnesyl-diphosphate synthase [Oceanococcus atlanticus]